jgi:hypothetical protein
MTAFAMSLLANFALLGVVGLTVLESALLRKDPMVPAAPPAEAVVMITPEMITLAPEMPAVPAEKRFARTSEDQVAAPEENPRFMGERNTRATSDGAAVADAPPLPSQKGIEPRDAADIETTESNYQDGKISSDPAHAASTALSPPVPPAPESPPTEPAPPSEVGTKDPETPGRDETRSVPPMREKLLDGPNPVDVQVPREVQAKPEDEIKPTPEQRPAAKSTPPVPKEALKVAETPKPAKPTDPAFKGFQRKTAIVGSISRTGRSSLDVEDTPLGRYQGAISRAVEQEWQRNCVRHRDFITPGFITVRFFVETSGKVRSVQFVGDMETGEVQKGFTLNSIRDAEIPAMPATLRKEYAKEPLELIFRFFF